PCCEPSDRRPIRRVPDARQRFANHFRRAGLCEEFLPLGRRGFRARCGSRLWRLPECCADRRCAVHPDAVRSSCLLLTQDTCAAESSLCRPIALATTAVERDRRWVLVV